MVLLHFMPVPKYGLVAYQGHSLWKLERDNFFPKLTQIFVTFWAFYLIHTVYTSCFSSGCSTCKTSVLFKITHLCSGHKVENQDQKLRYHQKYFSKQHNWGGREGEHLPPASSHCCWSIPQFSVFLETGQGVSPPDLHHPPAQGISLGCLLLITNRNWNCPVPSPTCPLFKDNRHTQQNTDTSRDNVSDSMHH